MKRNNKKIVYVAMSGGVDSSVAAALLKERGFDVSGIHIKMWSSPEIPCAFKEDRYDAMRVAARLNIPFETWDFTEEYKKEVVDYMIREYASGRTPNPDVMCNRHIKFGVFLKKSLERGADFVATGHYVRLSPEFPISNFQFSNKKKEIVENFEIENSLKIENYKLKIARDLNKDQSYFLWALNQEELQYCLFPIGEYTKPEVRELARKFGLPTAEKKESQGICFIGELDIRNFLKKHLTRPDLVNFTRSGLVKTADGRVIGKHEGLAFYTIGQRRGLGMGGGIPYYVAHKDLATNTLVVAEGPYDKELFSRKLAITDINWVSGIGPKFPLHCEARIRHRQPLQKCAVNKFAVRFDFPQRAVTPGQSIVFYKNREMLGGGVIIS